MAATAAASRCARATGINTLADFRIVRTFRAENGQPGGGQRHDRPRRRGHSRSPCPSAPSFATARPASSSAISSKAGMDCWSRAAARAAGATSASSPARIAAPRQFGPGLPGEARELELELKVIADVGLLGLPNAGKSTLISAVSAARPKIADYPFTTLHPNLGVVACGKQRSFVMADIPGLIEGAAEGAGLGIRFLKHLQRTRVLLHLVDIAPVDPDADPVRDARSIVGELKKFSEDLLAKPRWLVLNKSDLLPPEEATAKAIAIARALNYRGPAFLISGATRAGTTDLTEAVMRFLETAEAPAQGNLEVPVPKPAAKAAKSRAKAKPKAKAKARSKPTRPKAKRPSRKPKPQETRR